jgi:hypothetical protein
MRTKSFIRWVTKSLGEPGVNVIKLFSSSLTTSGLYYKPITIVNDNSNVINKLETSLTDYARVVNYDRHMFIVQATVQIS